MEDRKYKRGFLNQDEGTASFEWYCSAEEKWVSAGFSISDCNRKVNLDFDIWNSEHNPTDTLENRLGKLDMLISELKEFRKDLIKKDKKAKASMKEKESKKENG